MVFSSVKRFAPLALAPFLFSPAFSTSKELTGVRTAADSPALTPRESQQKFVLPDGFDIRLFASEPMVINPVAMSWDDRGRLWVAELFEYPLGAPANAVPRDTIKILEDTNGDERADQETVLKTGFGLEDRHGLLNGFTWGFDGWLYMTHGVFTHSKVRELDQSPELMAPPHRPTPPRRLRGQGSGSSPNRNPFRQHPERRLPCPAHPPRVGHSHRTTPRHRSSIAGGESPHLVCTPHR